MRTFGLSLGVAAAAAAFLAPSQLLAQRNARRSTPDVRASESAPVHRSAPVAPKGTSARHCTSNCGDYSLAIVSAVMPSESAGATSDVVTLVIENRGTIAAPVSMVSVSPQNHLSLARQSAIPALAPGQRTTIRLPVATAPDGTQCVSITISPAPVADPATARFLAAAIPDPHVDTGRLGDLASAVRMTELQSPVSSDPFASFRTLGSW